MENQIFHSSVVLFTPVNFDYYYYTNSVHPLEGRPLVLFTFLDCFNYFVLSIPVQTNYVAITHKIITILFLLFYHFYVYSWGKLKLLKKQKYTENTFHLLSSVPKSIVCNQLQAVSVFIKFSYMCMYYEHVCVCMLRERNL